MRGRRSGRLLVLDEAPNRPKVWKCLCDCGNETEVFGHDLRRNDKRRIKSCGCLRADQASASFTRHGMSQTRTYHSWLGMRQRCLNPNNSAFEHYGGRGIKVCERWQESFENFLADMGECPPGLSIDRIDNNGHYEPGNCRWATNHEQRVNQRKARWRKNNLPWTKK